MLNFVENITFGTVYGRFTNDEIRSLAFFEILRKAAKKMCQKKRKNWLFSCEKTKQPISYG